MFALVIYLLSLEFVNVLVMHGLWHIMGDKFSHRNLLAHTGSCHLTSPEGYHILFLFISLLL